MARTDHVFARAHRYLADANAERVDLAASQTEIIDEIRWIADQVLVDAAIHHRWVACRIGAERIASLSELAEQLGFKIARLERTGLRAI
jgi:hypothetical protein